MSRRVFNERLGGRHAIALVVTGSAMRLSPIRN